MIGRPTKYNPDFINRLDEYLATTGKEQMSLPTIEGFAIFLDVSRDSLYEWAKLYPNFSDTLRRIEILQKQQLINDGIYGGKEVNASIVKLILQNNHGMKERTDTTSGDKPLPILDLNVHTNNGNEETQTAK
jgi:hypothetical protein